MALSRHGLLHCECRFCPLADIVFCTAHVRYRGKADMTIGTLSALVVAIGCKADIACCGAYVGL